MCMRLCVWITLMYCIFLQSLLTALDSLSNDLTSDNGSPDMVCAYVCVCVCVCVCTSTLMLLLQMGTNLKTFQ